MAEGSVPGDRAEKLARGCIDDGEGSLILGLPVSPTDLDEGLRVGLGIGLRDGNETGDEWVLARGEHGRRIVRPPGTKRHGAVRERDFAFHDHRLLQSAGDSAAPSGRSARFWACCTRRVAAISFR